MLGSYRLFSRDDEVPSSILRPARLVVAGTERRVLPEAVDGDAICRNAERGEVRLDRLGAVFAEREIVFFRAAFVGVAFHPDGRVGPALQPVSIRRESRA